MVAIPILTLVGISDLWLRQNEVLNKLQGGPIVLTQRTQPVAVLVSLEQWNQIVERLEDLEDALDVAEARLNNEPTEDFAAYLADRRRRTPVSL